MSPRLVCLFLLLLSPLSWGAATYSTNIHPEVFHLTANDACASLASESDYPLVGPNGVVEGVYADGNMTCFYRYSDPSQFGGTRVNGFVVGGVSPYVTSKNCEAGGSETLTWPLGRQEANNDSTFASFGYPQPLYYCFDGCRGDVDNPSTGHDFFGQPDTDPKYEIIFANLAYVTTGEACSTADAEPIPDIPPPPTDNPDPCEANPAAEGCSGGGDPGGGDPGGGDPGGGDPGGGDPGGGDPGGGDPGGGDPGGGDPGGGDPGGGDNGGSAGGYANCDAPLACEGDAIACAQLYLQKQQYCEGKSQSDFPGQQDEIADFLDQPAMEAEEDEEINLGEMFSEGTRFLPSSCPQAKSFSLTTNGGRTFSLSFEPLCQFASDLSYLIVAAAAVFYALYVGRAVGGE